MADQRAGTRLPTDAEQTKVGEWFRISPDTTPVNDTRAKWDGKKEELRVELTAALSRATTDMKNDIAWRGQAHHIPMDQITSIARAAKRIVDGFYADWLTNAVLTREQAQTRSERFFTEAEPKKNIIEVSSETDRRSAGKPISAMEQAKSFASFNTRCREIMKNHGFRPYDHDRPEEKDFLQEILDAFVASNEQDLKICDAYGSSISDPASGRIFVSGAVKNWDGKDQKAPEPRARKLVLFTKIIHEYLHLLEHPLIPAETKQSSSVREGFCEYFTIQIIRHVRGLPAHELNEVIHAVEGDLDGTPAGRWNTYLRDYTPSDDYAEPVRCVREYVSRFGENAARAVFFQGHTEYLGRADGRWITMVPAAAAQVSPVPVGSAFGEFGDFLRITKLTPEQLWKYHPEWKSGGAPMPYVCVPGFRPHHVASVDDTAETWHQIGAQHGVNPNELAALYPEFRDPPGQSWLIIPAPK